MKLTKYLTILVVAASAMLETACVSDPLEDEQYKHVVALIGAYDVMQERKISYNEDGENTFVSVYCGGTTPPAENITVTLGKADQINIDNYNYKNVLDGEVKYQALPENWYSLPSMEGTIKAGDRYARIPIQIQTDKISCDSLYMIPLKLVSASHYEINPDDTVLLVKLKMINDYSDTYTMSGYEYGYKSDGVTVDSLSASPVNTSRTLQAVNKNTVRVFHNNKSENLDNVAGFTFILSVDDATGKVTVKPWADFPLLSGKGKYTYNDDPVKPVKTFMVEYDYMNGNNKKHVEVSISTGSGVSFVPVN